MNLLLTALPPADRSAFERELAPVALEHGQTLFEMGSQIDRIYFIDSGIISLVGVLSDGTTAEITTVGREGFVNAGSLLDNDLAIARHVVQAPGQARTMSAKSVRRIVREFDAARSLFHRYIQVLIAQISQSVVCNNLHSAEERLARWLLMTHDRRDGDDLALTHGLLAEMLGVRRPTVSVLARTFQTAGLIRYRRGSITVVDRAGLEEASCECHAIVNRQFRRLIPDVTGDRGNPH